MSRRLVRTVLLAALVLAALPACDPPPPRPLHVVTAVADGLDAAPGDGVCEVTPGGGDCSLRAAIAEASATGRGAVRVRAGTYALTVADPGDGDADLDVTADIELNWGRPEDVRVDATGTRVLDVHAGGRLSAHGVDLASNGSPGSIPGTVRVAGRLVLGESTIYQGFDSEDVTTPTLEVLAGGDVALSNSAVGGSATPAGVRNDGTLVASYSSITGLFTPAIETGPGGRTDVAATRVAQLGAFRTMIFEVDAPACLGTPLVSRGYNRVPNTSCGLAHPTDIQSRTVPWVDRIPAGVLGCGDAYRFDQAGAVRPGDGDFDGTAACDVGPVEAGVHVTIHASSAVTKATVGECYTLNLSRTGGQGTPVWSATGLPPGLALVGSRIIGIPTQAGWYTMVISVRTLDGGGSLTVPLEVLPSTDPPMVSCS